LYTTNTPSSACFAPLLTMSWGEPQSELAEGTIANGPNMTAASTSGAAPRDIQLGGTGSSWGDVSRSFPPIAVL
jgi:hypothetical protein